MTAETNSKTPSLRDAALMALEAMEHHQEQTRSISKTWDAISVIRAALALPEPEPVAILGVAGPNTGISVGWMPGYIAKHNDKLYLANRPAHVERQPLTDLDELAKVYASSYASPHHITFTVEGLRKMIEELDLRKGAA